MTPARNLAAIVLAAGTSERFTGGNKLLAAFKGTTVLGQTIQNLISAGIETITVISGYDSEAVSQLATGAGVNVLENQDFKQGMATSIAVGIAGLEDDVAGALIVLGDMPLVRPKTIRVLCQALDRGQDKKIIVPIMQQKRGNPVLWHRDFFPVLATLSGSRGAKQIIRSHPGVVLEVAVDDPGIHIDLDTREDIDAL